jgi:peptidyl-prolyl cis-trans isomerase SurA
MKKILIAGLLLIITFSESMAGEKQQILLTINKKEKIPMDEFRRVYERNNNNIQDTVNKKTAVEYLQLFINFKLKVLEAENAGMDTTSAFRQELSGYRAELATPYLTDINFNEKIIEETYHRLLKEINASHIMVRLTENASPADTLAAFRKITDIRDQVVKGLDFNDAAARYSEDPSAASNKGDLGWFTAFQMVYPFENMAYSTKVGEVSPPFRTRFGYHILKVQKMRDAEGEIHVAHIMKMYPQNASQDQKDKALQSLDSLYQMVRGGADFAEIARKYSDDKRSAEKGGEMPWFSRNKMIPEFANPAFELQNDGDISKPVDSGFGYHIIKRLEMKPIPSYEEAKADLTERLKRDKDRSSQSQEVFIGKLKNEYNFRSDEAAIDEVLKSTLAWLRGTPPGIPSHPEKSIPLFTYGKANITTGDWIEFLKKKDITTLTADTFRLPDLFRNFEDESIIAYEDSRLEQKYPDFKSLMDEYHDGMLLFDISEKKIWQKASADTAGLEKFYEINKQKYLWPDRFRGKIIQCYNPAIRDKAEEYFEMGYSGDEVTDAMHLTPGSISVREGVWAPNEDPVVDYYYWKGPRPADWNDRTGFLSGKLTGPEPKLLNEVRGYHIADYQQYLEDQWIKELRNKYPVKINKKMLKTLANE